MVPDVVPVGDVSAKAPIPVPACDITGADVDEVGMGAVVILTAMAGGGWVLMLPWEVKFCPATVVTKGLPGV